MISEGKGKRRIKKLKSQYEAFLLKYNETGNLGNFVY